MFLLKKKNNEFIFHSFCIFDSLPQNEKQVTLYINEYLFCRINCYHDKCKLYNKYYLIQNELNQNFYTIIVNNPTNEFIETSKTIEQIYNM